MDADDQFRAHLDGCAQCRNNPFALCEAGAALLKKASDWVTYTYQPSDNGEGQP